MGIIIIILWPELGHRNRKRIFILLLLTKKAIIKIYKAEDIAVCKANY